MFETLDRIMLAGLGAMSMTREKAEQIFDEYVRRGEQEKGNRSRFVNEMMDTAAKTRRDMEEMVARQVSQALKTMNLPTKEDFDRLESKIDLLLSRTGHQ